MTAPATPAVAADAKSRALRTLAQGLVVDVLLAVFGVVGVWLGAGDFSKAALVGLAVLMGKTALQTAISYAMRYMVPPRTDQVAQPLPPGVFAQIQPVVVEVRPNMEGVPPPES